MTKTVLEGYTRAFDATAVRAYARGLADGQARDVRTKSVAPWQPTHEYAVGDAVLFRDVAYRCRKGHFGWRPDEPHGGVWVRA